MCDGYCIYSKPGFVKDNLIHFRSKTKRSAKQQKIINNYSFNVSMGKNGYAKNFYTSDFMTLDKAFQESKNWSHSSAGLSHNKRSIVVIDCDLSESVESFYNRIVNDLHLKPNYIKHHNTNGHNQAGFYCNEINIKDNRKHREYLDVIQVINEHFFMKGFDGWRLQNPYFESEEYTTVFYHKDILDFQTIKSSVKGLSEYNSKRIFSTLKKEAVKIRKKCEKNIKEHRGWFINGKFFADFSWCANSRHNWVLAKTNEEIINYRNANNGQMPTVEWIVAEIYGKWPPEYNKSEEYTLRECQRDVFDALVSFKPRKEFVKDKNGRFGFSDIQRLISIRKRHLQKLVKIYNMLSLIQNTNISGEEARKRCKVSTNAYKQYRKYTVEQIMDEIIEASSGLREWGIQKNIVFETLVKNIKGLSHSSPLYDKIKEVYEEEIQKDKEKKFHSCMGRTYPFKIKAGEEPWIACGKWIQKQLSKNNRFKKLKSSA